MRLCRMMEFSLLPRMVLSYLIPTPWGFMGPTPQTQLLVLICHTPPHPYILQFFFLHKTYFININVLDITIKFITSNQTNF